MDESRKSGDSAPAKYPRQNDEVSAENLGATGVFGAAPESTGDPGGEEPLREPVVHKVVLGGSQGAAPAGLHSVLRPSSWGDAPPRGATVAESQARPWTTASEPAAARFPESAPGQSGQGFTQLLRALGGDSSLAATTEQPDFGRPLEAKSAVVTPEPREAGTDTGFTSLLRTLNPNQQSYSANEPPTSPVTTPVVPQPESAGGFTALLQGFSETGPEPGERQRNGTRPYENLGSASAASFDTARGPVADRPGPGGFTQLLSALNPEAASSVAAEPVVLNPQVASPPATYPEPTSVIRPPGSGSSFTQLLSTLGEPSAKAPTYDDKHLEVLEDFSRRPSIGRQDSSAAGQLPTEVTDWPRTTLPPAEPPRGGGSLTQLIRMLDEPSKGPENPVAYRTEASPVAPPSAGGSTFTETYRKLDGRAEALSPESPASYSELSATRPFSSQSGGDGFPNQWAPAPVEPTLAAGPSEVTRILGLSKMRELERPGAAAPAQAGPGVPSPAQASTPMPQMPPSLHWPSPSMPATPPGQPANFGGAMQMPQYTPPAPVPQAPAPPAAPGMSKMQQYLPLLLIIIICLLLVILATVVFFSLH